MSRGIKLSKEHGLNPSLVKCYICGNDVAIALMGRLKGDAKAPMECITGDICNDCKKVIDEGGSFVVEAREDRTPTGRYVRFGSCPFKKYMPIALMLHNDFEQLLKDCKKNEGND